MKPKFLLPALLIVLLAFYLFVRPVQPPSVAPGVTEKVAKGQLNVFSVYEGKLDARRASVIMSRFQGNATVIELAPDGARVSKGDVLVRFDSSALEREILKLERDYAQAKSELESLINAKLPLELRELEIKLMKARSSASAEQQYLDTITEFAKEDVLYEQEIKQEKMKVAELKTTVATLEQQAKLTKAYLHPSALKQAQAKLSAAEQELKLARDQFRNTVVLAPMEGFVIHKQIPIGSEYRTIHVGDPAFPNQPFMVLPDMSSLVVHCNIPESELSRVQAGNVVFVQPLAYPDVRLRGSVQSIGSGAQSAPELPAWQKFFQVVIGLNEIDPRLKPGMSVTAHILLYQNPDALLVPRSAVRWEAETPFVKVAKGSVQETRRVRLGRANEKSYEVIEGLNPGDKVLIHE